MNFSENVFLNFHAHQQMPAENEIVIQSLFLQNDLITKNSDKIFFTAGLHPWHADQLSESKIIERLETLLQNKSIIAIGETGLDKLKGVDWETQKKVFRAHIEIADKYNLPLIVHSVKAHNEVLKLKIESKSKIPWVIHHFNGSKQMAMDFINHGFYLSLCNHINNSGSKLSGYLGELPVNRIFLETDDFNIDIKDLYSVAAKKFNMNIENFKKQLINNLNSLLNG
ncbi:MAG: TatD family hydrolase [Bacteroidales bacterium]|nr:TatD family hydrolase [Bacteroidales bacterium]